MPLASCSNPSHAVSLTFPPFCEFSRNSLFALHLPRDVIINMAFYFPEYLKPFQIQQIIKKCFNLGSFYAGVFLCYLFDLYWMLENYQSLLCSWKNMFFSSPKTQEPKLLEYHNRSALYLDKDRECC